ncbi:MAG: beta-eliminating lyase-related protein [Pseudomonadota bacterium]
MNFGSDNQSGASDAVLRALSEAFTGTADAYGHDHFSQAAEQALKRVFDTELSVFFVVSGTAANSLALSSMVQPWDGIVCHHQAHILLDESSGPALFSGGASLLPVPSRALKISPDALRTMLQRFPNEPPHNIRPRALSISQANESGQVYTVDEVVALGQCAKEAGLRFHMDGARFANAVAALGCAPADLTWRAGVDVLCLGATKNGAVACEAVVCFDQALATDFHFRMKRSGHLVSKSRLFGAQMVAWLENDHWLELARTANDRARYLRASIAGGQGVRLAFDSESNETFILLDKSLFERLSRDVSLFDWYPDALPDDNALQANEMIARLVTSFNSTEAEIDRLIALINRLSST